MEDIIFLDIAVYGDHTKRSSKKNEMRVQKKINKSLYENNRGIQRIVYRTIPLCFRILKGNVFKQQGTRQKNYVPVVSVNGNIDTRICDFKSKKYEYR